MFSVSLTFAASLTATTCDVNLETDLDNIALTNQDQRIVDATEWLTFWFPINF